MSVERRTGFADIRTCMGPTWEAGKKRRGVEVDCQVFDLNNLVDGDCYRLNVCIPLNWYVETLIPRVMVSEYQTFGRCLVGACGALLMGFEPLYEDTGKPFLLLLSAL